jgi:hypothetical protein
MRFPFIAQDAQMEKIPTPAEAVHCLPTADFFHETCFLE